VPAGFLRSGPYGTYVRAKLSEALRLGTGLRALGRCAGSSMVAGPDPEPSCIITSRSIRHLSNESHRHASHPPLNESPGHLKSSQPVLSTLGVHNLQGGACDLGRGASQGERDSAVPLPRPMVKGARRH